jgi:hypothetical protein
MATSKSAPIPSTAVQQSFKPTPHVYKGKPLYIMHVGMNAAEMKALQENPPDGWIGLADMAAALSGKLEVLDDCLVLAPPGGGPPLSVVMRLHEFTWDNPTSTLIYRGKPYQIGDPFTSGGGSVQAGYFSSGDKFEPYKCDVNGLFLFVN